MMYDYLTNVGDFTKELRKKYRGLIHDYDVFVAKEKFGIPEWYSRMAGSFFFWMKEKETLISDLFLGIDAKFDFDTCRIEISKILTEDISIKTEIETEYYLRRISPKNDMEIRDLHQKLYNNPSLGELLEKFKKNIFSTSFEEELGEKLNIVRSYSEIVWKVMPDQIQDCRYDSGRNWRDEIFSLREKINLYFLCSKGAVKESIDSYVKITGDYMGPGPNKEYDDLFIKIKEVIKKIRG